MRFPQSSSAARRKYRENRRSTDFAEKPAIRR
ncbi:MAG TPA: hypothetical protein DEF06_02940, partial [Clostridiales bacterium]|nr:hypothetical protein [Clostridiales bacterium]